MIVSLVALVFIAPSMYFGDRVTVSKEGFTIRTGFWWKPTIRDVRFADLSKIELVPRGTSQLLDKEYDLVCFRKEGGHEIVPVSDLMKLGADAQILQTAKERGIEVLEKH
jgi:hypothetical protein